jgi:hypothetical protein
LLLKETFKNEKDFQYEVHKQIYLELVEKQEYQKVELCFFKSPIVFSGVHTSYKEIETSRVKKTHSR